MRGKRSGVSLIEQAGRGGKHTFSKLEEGAQDVRRYERRGCNVGNTCHRAVEPSHTHSGAFGPGVHLQAILTLLPEFVQHLDRREGRRQSTRLAESKNFLAVYVVRDVDRTHVAQAANTTRLQVAKKAKSPIHRHVNSSRSRLRRARTPSLPIPINDRLHCGTEVCRHPLPPNLLFARGNARLSEERPHVPDIVVESTEHLLATPGVDYRADDDVVRIHIG